MDWNLYYASLGYPVIGTFYEWRWIKRYSPGYGFSIALTPEEALRDAIQLVHGATLQSMYFTRLNHGYIRLNFIA